MVKSARLLLVAALLAVVGACAPTKPEPAVTPMAALPEPPPPPMMVPSMPRPRRAPSTAPRKRLSSVKKHRHGRSIRSPRRPGKHTKSRSTPRKKSHHTRSRRRRSGIAPASTKFASRVKPGWPRSRRTHRHRRRCPQRHVYGPGYAVAGLALIVRMCRTGAALAAPVFSAAGAKDRAQLRCFKYCATKSQSTWRA